MMKRFLKMLLLATVILSGCKKSKPVEAEPEKKLAMIEGILTPFRNGQPDPAAKFLWSTKEFNDDGKPRQEMVSIGGASSRYNEKLRDIVYFGYKYKDGKMVSKYRGSTEYRYSYNANDTAQMLIYDYAGKLQYIHNYEYKDGKLFKDEAFYEGNSILTSKFFYDIKGFVNKKEMYWGYHANPEVYLYTTNDRGDILKIEILDKNGTKHLNARHDYKYDANDLLIEHTFFALGGEIFTPNPNKRVHTYDKDKKLIKTEIWEATQFEGPFTQLAIIDYTYTYK